MAAVVCQGLQSCHESTLAESRTLRLRLSSPKPHFSQSLELALRPCFLDSNIVELSEKYHFEEISHKPNFLNVKRTTSNSDSGGLSFLEVLNTSQCPKESIEKENTYDHPLVKRSSSMLSEKSLELCTENLGSETGTDIIETSILSLSSSDSKIGNSPTRKQQKSSQFSGEKKANSRSFPPPLTTMSGSESIHVRHHREDGRLVIKAVKAPSTSTYFRAERSNGRLRLSFVEDSYDNLPGTSAATTEVCQNEEEIENDVNYDQLEEAEEEKEDNFEGATEEGSGESCGEEMSGNDMGVGPELEMEEYQRPSRCKQGELENRGLRNWEPLWVATS